MPEPAKTFSKSVCELRTGMKSSEETPSSFDEKRFQSNIPMSIFHLNLSSIYDTLIFVYRFTMLLSYILFQFSGLRLPDLLLRELALKELNKNEVFFLVVRGSSFMSNLPKNVRLTIRSSYYYFYNHSSTGSI